MEGGGMANEENLKRLTPSEAREYGRRGGQRSGEVRRQRINFRKTLNAILACSVDNPEWEATFAMLGLDNTLENAVNIAMIKEATKGNVKAYEAIARYAGQSEKTEADEAEQKIRTDRAKRARDQEIGDETGAEENIRAFMKAMRPTQEELDNLFTEEGVEDGEEAEETGKV